MRQAITFFMLITFFNVNGQNTDYSKKSPKELVKDLTDKDNKIKELENIIKQSSEKSNIKILENKNLELLDIITKSNEVYLYEIFQNRYILDSEYFKNVDLDEKTTSKIINSIVLVNSILAGKNCSEKDKEIGAKVLKLRENYLKINDLDKVYQTTLNEKYDEKNVNLLISKMDSLVFDFNSKLDNRKNNYLGILKNYSKYACELRKELAKNLKNPNQDNPLVKNEYEKLKKNTFYKTYPYLIKIIDKVKTKPITYVDKDDLPCAPKIEENTTIMTKEIMQEEKKPTETKKE